MRKILPISFVLYIILSCSLSKQYQYYSIDNNSKKIGHHNIIIRPNGEEIIVTAGVLFGSENKMFVNIKSQNDNSINISSSKFGNLRLREIKNQVKWFSTKIDENLIKNQLNDLIKKDTITVYISDNEFYKFVQNYKNLKH